MVPSRLRVHRSPDRYRRPHNVFVLLIFYLYELILTSRPAWLAVLQAPVTLGANEGLGNFVSIEGLSIPTDSPQQLRAHY